jgi:hypothetical protein
MSPAISSDFGLVFPNIFQHFPVELAVEFTLRWTFSVDVENPRVYPSANLQMVTGFHIYLVKLQYNISPTWNLAANSGIYNSPF